MPQQPNSFLNFQVRRADEGESVSGLIAFTAVRGKIVTHQLDADGNKILVLADGQRGFHLERDVVSEIPLENIVFQKDFIHPDLVNTDVSARKCQEVECEGADLIQLSGTGLISSSTPLNTALGVTQGKYRVKQSGDELQGYLRGVIPAIGDGDFRIMVEEVD